MGGAGAGDDSYEINALARGFAPSSCLLAARRALPDEAAVWLDGVLPLGPVAARITPPRLRLPSTHGLGHTEAALAATVAIAVPPVAASREAQEIATIALIERSARLAAVGSAQSADPEQLAAGLAYRPGRVPALALAALELTREAMDASAAEFEAAAYALERNIAGGAAGSAGDEMPGALDGGMGSGSMTSPSSSSTSFARDLAPAGGGGLSLNSDRVSVATSLTARTAATTASVVALMRPAVPGTMLAEQPAAVLLLLAGVQTTLAGMADARDVAVAVRSHISAASGRLGRALDRWFAAAEVAQRGLEGTTKQKNKRGQAKSGSIDLSAFPVGE